MKNKWSLRGMFWWLFVIALTLPYFKSLLPKRESTPIPLTAFSFSDEELKQWILDVEPTLRVWGGSTGSLTSVESMEAEFEYYVTTESTEPKDVLRCDVLSNVRSELQKSIAENGLLIWGKSISDESFSFVLATGHSRYRIYVRTIPFSESQAESWEVEGEPLLCMKLILIGYNQPPNASD